MEEAPQQRVAFGERLAYQNVVSSRETFHFSELAARFEEFASAIAKRGYDPQGPFFYSLNNVPLDEVVDIEMFLPIRQGTFDDEPGLFFHSYFEMSPLLHGVVGGDFENRTEQVYAQLLGILDANGLVINSPFVHVVHRDASPSVSVYVGYSQPND
ncbi:DUF5085 family protein [Leifsonia shinshuensis]|uniref:DUF5085 family protein n=1 Tax=Leifsonia shinshuensis TaxID=150026 RepID=A0A7G6YFG7_9MICO|nr:DUF5085 family protein [Leifsonia shinshuensis]QNE37232.1 DUF5085 family protein [Leifsonia shinshuensis]